MVARTICWECPHGGMLETTTKAIKKNAKGEKICPICGGVHKKECKDRNLSIRRYGNMDLRRKAHKLQKGIEEMLYKYDFPHNKAEFSSSFGNDFFKLIVTLELIQADVSNNCNRVFSRIDITQLDDDSEPIMLIGRGRKTLEFTEANFWIAVVMNVVVES